MRPKLVFTRAQSNRGPKPVGLTTIAFIVVWLAACGQSIAPEVVEPGATGPVALGSVAVQEAPAWRFVNSGWAELTGADKAGPFAQELRVFVITSQQELDDFNAGFTLRRTRGTAASLGRVEFSRSILLAVYYLWRPLQGDPLSVVGLSVDGNRATVRLQLEESAQGKLYPYLMAPMTMVAVKKDLFPMGEPVEFEFLLNGEPAAAMVATVP